MLSCSRIEMKWQPHRKAGAVVGGVDKESDLVGRNTAAWGHKLPWPWLHFRSFLQLLSLFSFWFDPSSDFLSFDIFLCCASYQNEISNSHLSVKHDIPVLSSQKVGRLTLGAGALWNCGSWQSSARPVCPGLWSIQAGALPFGGRTPAGPAAAAAGTQTAAPDIETAPPAGYGSLHIKKNRTFRTNSASLADWAYTLGLASSFQTLLEVSI